MTYRRAESKALEKGRGHLRPFAPSGAGLEDAMGKESVRKLGAESFECVIQAIGLESTGPNHVC